eukprot:CAMPEP_0206146956 /NCGR_PEP_ID=MMETSP1473-20131121/31940_1 /ASSEMBLY_ACC=CAM_ASM_001109 /TAXON_ID=1461547 /ORGANISM="Stichococcus sp, Strain RCC1054" /LENGTH=104 /DNA_ID=CAMNT_0053543703 /DNA_START=185 /DNA_END=496 /DNA_ORIENTATION=-
MPSSPSTPAAAAVASAAGTTSSESFDSSIGADGSALPFAGGSSMRSASSASNRALARWNFLPRMCCRTAATDLPSSWHVIAQYSLSSKLRLCTKNGSYLASAFF